MMKPPPVDSSFVKLIHKIDSLNIKNSVDTIQVQLINNVNIPKDSHDFGLAWFIEILFFPILLIGLTVWLTQYFTKSSDQKKEYTRLIKLDLFIKTWIPNLIVSANFQIQTFRRIRQELANINNTQFNFTFTLLDIDKVTKISGEDLYKVFIELKRLNDVELKSKNLFDLLHSLDNLGVVISNYRSKSTEVLNAIHAHHDRGAEELNKLRHHLVDLSVEINSLRATHSSSQDLIFLLIFEKMFMKLEKSFLKNEKEYVTKYQRFIKSYFAVYRQHYPTANSLNPYLVETNKFMELFNLALFEIQEYYNFMKGNYIKFGSQLKAIIKDIEQTSNFFENAGNKSLKEWKNDN